MFINFLLHSSNTIFNAHVNATLTQIIIRQFDGHDVHVVDHAAGKYLKQNLTTVVRCFAIKSTAAGCSAQLTGGGYQNELGIWRQYSLYAGSDIIHVVVWGNIADNQCRPFGNVKEGS